MLTSNEDPRKRNATPSKGVFVCHNRTLLSQRAVTLRYLLLFLPAIADVESDYGTDSGSDCGRDHTHCQHRHDTEHSAHLLPFGVLPDESRSIGGIISESFQSFKAIDSAARV